MTDEPGRKAAWWEYYILFSTLLVLNLWAASTPTDYYA